MMTHVHISALPPPEGAPFSNAFCIVQLVSYFIEIFVLIKLLKYKNIATILYHVSFPKSINCLHFAPFVLAHMGTCILSLSLNIGSIDSSL